MSSQQEGVNQGIPAPATESAESPPINDTPLRRFLVLAAIRLFKKFRPRAANVFLLSDRLINDALHRPAYLHTGAKSPLRFYTPWLDIYPDGEDRWRDGWAGIGPSKGKIEGKDSLAAQKIDARDAKHVVSEHGFDERQWRISFRLSTSWSLLRFGSFKSIEEIHKKLRQGIQFHPKLDPEVIELINLHDRLWPPPVFTHGDLSSLNILVRGDGVVGIIDWETAGWLPSYWEYTTACQVNPQNYLWRDEIDRFLDPMPAELAMGKIYQKYFGDF